MPDANGKTGEPVKVKVLGIVDKLPLKYDSAPERFTMITT
jgi:hypothetical protein